MEGDRIEADYVCQKRRNLIREEDRSAFRGYCKMFLYILLTHDDMFAIFLALAILLCAVSRACAQLTKGSED